MCSFYYHQKNEEKMSLLPILSIIHTVTVGTMLNSNGGNNGHGFKDVTCKQAFSLGIPSSNIVEPHLVEPLLCKGTCLYWPYFQTINRYVYLLFTYDFLYDLQWISTCDAM